MISAGDLDHYYRKEDPWSVKTTSIDNSIRDKIFYDLTAEYAHNKAMIELGCGEGVHTHNVFAGLCQKVLAVDISKVAINRAEKKTLDNVTYKEIIF